MKTKIKKDWTEEEICCEYSEGWRHFMPVLLITWKGGEKDLHCQSGDHHDKAIAKATEIMRERGYEVDSTLNSYGPSGLYYRLRKIQKSKVA